jgi:acyl-CoA reductase-like NAD-dependent aldehyde dehydrogenase
MELPYPTWLVFLSSHYYERLLTFPAAGKIASALLTGNCLIMKPSPFTPYCGLKMAELAQQFFPPGVFQVLSGDDNLGPWITAHPGIDKISFTGSTATGKRVMESASKTLKRVTLELYVSSTH